MTAYLTIHVIQSISIIGSYVGNRQDAREALDIAARGQVKVTFESKDLKDLKEYAHFHFASPLLVLTLIPVCTMACPQARLPEG